MACVGAAGVDQAVDHLELEEPNCSGWVATRKTLQDPFMSTKDRILSAIVDLQSQIGEIGRKLDGLKKEVQELDEYELVGSVCDEQVKELEKKEPLPRGYTGTPPSGAVVSSRCSGEPSELERQEAAKATGHFFARCLAGQPRGNSGRSRIRLQNNIYVLVRSITGAEYTDPVLVFTAFSRLKPYVANFKGEFGSSIFAGFNTEWEARLAVREAGLCWPLAS